LQNGVAVVKLMGRHAGFMAIGAAVACQDGNFCLIPNVPFRLEAECGFLNVLLKRIQARAHAVVVVAEGVGQDLQAGDGSPRQSLVARGRKVTRPSWP